MSDGVSPMTSSRPYLIRAMFNWIVDNNLTPHLLVDTTQAGVEVPTDYVDDGRIVLNIGPGATHNLELGGSEITFSARFSGKAMWVTAPVASVTAIYAKENGQGMMFSDDGDADRSSDSVDKEDGPNPDGDGPGDGPKRPQLRIVK